MQRRTHLPLCSSCLKIMSSMYVRLKFKVWQMFAIQSFVSVLFFQAAFSSCSSMAGLRLLPPDVLSNHLRLNPARKKIRLRQRKYFQSGLAIRCSNPVGRIDHHLRIRSSGFWSQISFRILDDPNFVDRCSSQDRGGSDQIRTFRQHFAARLQRYSHILSRGVSYLGNKFSKTKLTF